MLHHMYVHIEGETYESAFSEVLVKFLPDISTR